MSAADRSTLRRLLSGLFFALALAFLLAAHIHGQIIVLIPDPCKTAEPGSWWWYFNFCFLDAPAFLHGAFDLLFGGMTPTSVLVR